MAVLSPQRIEWLARKILPHEAELRTWLRRRPLVGLDVDDVVQESYVILAGLGSVDHIRNPRTYLFEVAKSVVLMALRRSRVVSFSTLADIEGLEISCDAPGPESIAAGRQELSRVAALIADLPPKCREVFTLRKVHELSQREVARKMGISENTVEKHMGRAIRLLSAAIAYGGKSAIAASDAYDRDFARPEPQGNRLAN
ncbi:RNA polymerase sigma factor [Sphingopyxis sp. PAMC25046]|uniref:RNA polymerase sigma factor n=1 Tax=Sphingopyxis sp. PAMC25046 TaxID=2565556 RepID=UPI00109DF9E0|nr:RNA polymerase sigma factor [Sphingopyxis sp. PAMC25046]QCB56118.1 RNA polymerase sigma factor [Sphingopyxis sp. PAMC25046]